MTVSLTCSSRGRAARKPPSDLVQLRNISLVGLIMAMSARAREESRGLHTRLDFPETDPLPRESWCRVGEGGGGRGAAAVGVF